jgi:hypothetical protein
MKRETIALVSGAVLLTGCGEEPPKVVYRDPTPEQIQAAVDQALLKLNKEQEELKSFVSEMKKTDPGIVDARYDYDASGEKVIKIAMDDPNHTSGLVEYALPIATGALAGYAGARLAHKLHSYTRRGSNGYGDCGLKDLLTNDIDCRRYNRPSFFSTYPSYRYPSWDRYQTVSRKERKIYSAKTTRKTAAQRANLIKSKSKNHYSKSTLSHSRQAFSTKRSSSRSSSMSWGSSRSWGG